MRRCSLFILFTASAIAQSHFATGMLAAHNSIRARLHIAPLTWSDKLAEHAQSWADALLARGLFVHSKSPFGENLFKISGAHASPGLVVDDWASEAQEYDYRTNHCRKVCGHYTQIVWAATREVGCGVARDTRNEIWVCNYDPPGNWVGKRPY
jgi:uncharacterized protein YkwD